MPSLRFDAYGRQLIVERDGEVWRVYDRGGEGKRRPAEDLLIPPDLAAHEIERYLADQLHELATPARPDVRRIS